MKSIIADLFYGKINPNENFIPKNEGFNVNNQKISTTKNLLKSVLSKEDYTQLEHLETLYTSSSEMFSTEAFARGFSLGVKLIIEVYYSNANLQEILNKIN